MIRAETAEPSRREQSKNARRTAILDAARSLIRENGPLVSAERIAQRAGVATATVSGWTGVSRLGACWSSAVVVAVARCGIGLDVAVRSCTTLSRRARGAGCAMAASGVAAGEGVVTIVCALTAGRVACLARGDVTGAGAASGCLVSGCGVSGWGATATGVAATGVGSTAGATFAGTTADALVCVAASSASCSVE